VDEFENFPSVKYPPGGVRRVSGRIKVHPAGYGFVVPSDNSEDVHVSARGRSNAMDGDTVEVEVWSGVRGFEGRVVRVVARGRAKITGQLARLGRHTVLQPDDPRITGSVSLVGAEHLAATQLGQAVVAEITRYPETADGPIEARVLRVLGDPDDPRTEVEKVLAIAGIEDQFPDEVERIAAGLPQLVTPKELEDRADLRDIPFTTIDPETARDFDDAVAVESLPGGGTRLWVAVADVSHYVRDGAPIDVEARKRGCSLYLPNRAIPMLPEPLSAHLCSLVPEEDRLALVVSIDFDAHAEATGADFSAAVIHSRARLDYPGVAAALGGDTRGKRRKYEVFLPDLRHMDSLARQLRARRLLRGSLDFDLPEAFVELDHDDPRLVRDIRKSRRDPGERQAYSMIEEFMLAANEAVARSFRERNEETVWRIHDAPDAGRLKEFAELAGHYGIIVDVDDARTPRGLRRVLERMKGHAAEKSLSFALLRSLKQATYDVGNVGHFGLASSDYLHFTSPIRRYPDLIVHRLLKTRLAGQHKPAGGFKSAADEPLPDRAALQKMAAESSFSERSAMEAEREVVDIYRAYFMRDRVGDVFDGTISGVMGFGLFVVIDQPFIEGLVRVEALSDDYYLFDDVTARLVGRRSGRVFALGDSVRVEVQSVSVVRRKIDFALYDEHRGRDGRSKGRDSRPGARHDAEGTTKPGRRRALRKAQAGAGAGADGAPGEPAVGHRAHRSGSSRRGRPAVAEAVPAKPAAKARGGGKGAARAGAAATGVASRIRVRGSLTGASAGASSGTAPAPSKRVGRGTPKRGKRR
jgi:ribonuclease R